MVVVSWWWSANDLRGLLKPPQKRALEEGELVRRATLRQDHRSLFLASSTHLRISSLRTAAEKYAPSLSVPVIYVST